MKKCSFCSRTEKDFDFLLPSADQKVAICNHCIDFGYQVLMDYFDMEEEEKATNLDFDISTVPVPKAIKEKLDEYVIGQDKAKIALAVAQSNKAVTKIYVTENGRNLHNKGCNENNCGKKGCDNEFKKIIFHYLIPKFSIT